MNGLYEVSNLGEVRSLISNRILKTGKSFGGYVHVSLYKNKKGKTKKMHRLVSEVFIPNPENKPQINHIDGNKENNKVNNLEWCTASENQIHAFKLGISKKPKGKDSTSSVKINQYDREMNFIKQWNSMKDIERDLKIRVGNIWTCCNGRKKTAGNYIWRYADKEEI